MNASAPASSPSDKREQKRLDDQAETMMQSFSAAVDGAFETEVAYISDQLRKNKALAYTISGLLKNDTLAALLDGRLRAAHSQAADGAATKTEAPKKLRAGAKKWAHLKRQVALIVEILKDLLPSHFEGAFLISISCGAQPE